MIDPQQDPVCDAVVAVLERQLEAIEAIATELRELLSVPAHRVWFCPFSSHELIELHTSVDPASDGRSIVLYASAAEQLRETPLRTLTRLQCNDEGGHPRWDNVIRDLGINAAARAPLWEADLCLAADDESGELARVGVVTLFDPTGHTVVPDELSPNQRTEARELLGRLTQHVATYRKGRRDLELLGALEHRFTREIVGARGEPDAAGLFESVAQWFRRIMPASVDVAVDGDEPAILPHVCALFIKDENRLVLIDATRDYKVATTLAVDGQHDNPLSSVPLDNSDSLFAFAYDVLSREHGPLIFPSGRGDGALVTSLLEDLRQRLGRMTGGEDDDELPVSPTSARAMLQRFFGAVKHRGSCAFFPLMRREEVEGVLVMFCAERTFFGPANTLFARAVAERVGRLPDLLPDHRQDKDYRDRQTRLVYVEQRHQRIDRYLTGGQRVRAVAFLDLDDFRGINETYGHKVGDRVIEAVMEGLVVAAHRPGLLGNTYSAMQFIDQEKAKIDAEQYAATELCKTRRRKRLRLLPLHYGGDEFGLVFLSRGETSEKETVFVCQQVVEDLIGFVRFRLAGQLDAGRLSMTAGLALPSRLEHEAGHKRNDFALYTGLRDLGDELMYYAKDSIGPALYCPGHTVVEHLFELTISEGGPNVWRAGLLSARQVGDRVPMSGDIIHLDLLHSLQRTVGRHIRSGEEREAILRRIKKSMSPVRFEIIYRLPQASGRGAREEFLVRQLDTAQGVTVGVGERLYGHVRA